MNIFYVPSWYPNPNDPIYGIFIKEEIELIAKHNSSFRLAISTWGQGDEKYLLWAGKPFSSIKKVLDNLFAFDNDPRAKSPEATQDGGQPHQLKTYFTPAFTWTRKILNGNRRSILKSNRMNLQNAISDFGEIDLIHVYASYPGAIIANELSKEFNIPYVITSHMSPFPFDEFLDGSGNIVGWLDRPIKKSSALIATSRSARKDIENFGIEVSKVVPIARDLDLFKIDSTVDKNEDFTFLAVGRLVPQKGFDFLIEAFSKLEGNYRLRIVGEGEERENLERLISRYSLKDVVTLTGVKDRSSVIEEMQSCDVFVLSSRHETFGNVVVEAAACGKPVIATACGGPEDIVTQDIGLLIEKESTPALFNALSKAEDLVKKLNPLKIRESVLERFGSKNITDQIIEVYNEAMNRERLR